MAKFKYNKLAVARLDAIKRMPYMASIMYTLVPVPRPGLGTLATSKDARLLYDPEFCEQLTDEQLGAVLIHECMHLLQDHYNRAESKGVMPKKPPKDSDVEKIVQTKIDNIMDCRRWNMAADCEINDDLMAGSIPLPSEGPLAGVFPKTFDLDDGDLAENYYDAIREKQEDEDGSGDGEGFEQKQHVCGSCAGAPHPDEDPQQGEAQGRSSQDVKRAQRDTALAIKAAEAKQRGSVPGGLVRWADEIVAPPKVDWKRAFAARIRKCISQQAGLVDFTYRRPSRRQSSMKNIVLPSMVMPIPTVGVIVDTSGSMSERELGEGLGQIRHVLSVIRADVHLAICDCDVHNVKKVRNIKEVQASLVGGGGSDMSPAIAELEKRKCDFIIGISDCMVGYPAEPPRAKVIWLRTGNYTSDPPFGDVVDIQLDA